MKDSELAAKTHDDILAFLWERLPSDGFRDYRDDLAIKAEGLFQWAAVASEFILDPPGRFGYSKKKCINHLLKPSTKRDGQDPFVTISDTFHLLFSHDSLLYMCRTPMTRSDSDS